MEEIEKILDGIKTKIQDRGTPICFIEADWDATLAVRAALLGEETEALKYLKSALRDFESLREEVREARTKVAQLREFMQKLLK